MNVFTTKISSYLNAHKYKTLAFLVVLNGVLLFITHHSKVQLFGKVEAIGYRWTTYTELYKNHIDSQIHYSELDSGEENYQSMEYHYEYSKSKGKDYIVLGHDKPVSVRYNRAYYIDEQCNVFFFGRAKRTLSNMSFRCVY
ncbi:hypothetical protein [Vibrio campbellii]|uniref:hypothetical protein n=1 Tax=Vibrio campbellii TaxID=680 RepID=UPI0005F0A029|nr:hypothetical protein [Vibrio campbellii]